MSKVYLIITCSIDNKVGVKWAGRRRQEYFLGVSNVLEHARCKDIKPIIIENSKDNASYLDVFDCTKFYTKDNHFVQDIEKEIIYHKGVNEIRDIKKTLELFDIDDDDMIIKFTGRYMLFQDDFFKLVLDNLDKDVIFKEFNVVSHTAQEDDMVMGLFAMKAKYFKEFEYTNFDLGCEQELRTWFNEKVLPEAILKTNTLYLRVCIGEDHKMVDV
jgi:hypothetical protein